MWRCADEDVGIIGKAPAKITPNPMVKIPSTCVMISSWTAILAPSPPKSAPYETKSTENPKTKSDEPRRTRPRDCENPAAYAR